MSSDFVRWFDSCREVCSSTLVCVATCVVSMCGRAGAQFVSVFAQLQRHKNHDAPCPAGWFEGVVGCQARVLSRTVCETEDVFSMFTIAAKSLVGQSMFCYVTVQFLTHVRDNLCMQRCAMPFPLPFYFCCDRLHLCVFVCASSRCGVSYRFLHLVWGQIVIGCILE